MFKMTGLDIFLIIFAVLVVMGGLVVLILGVAGYFAGKDIKKLLNGPFSLQSGLDKSKHLTFDSKNDLILNNSDTTSCNDYTWTYNSSDNTLESSGTFNKEGDALTNALLGTTSTEYVVTAAAATSGSVISLKAKGTPGNLNQWVFNHVELTWCLKSNNKLCMFSTDDAITLDTLSINDKFTWVPVDALKSPSCKG